MRGYDTMISSGKHTLRNYLIFRTWPFNRVFALALGAAERRAAIEGINLADCRAIKQAVVGAGALHGRLPDRVGGGGARSSAATATASRSGGR